MGLDVSVVVDWCLVVIKGWFWWCRWCRWYWVVVVVFGGDY